MVVEREARAAGDEVAEDHVLLEAAQLVHAAAVNRDARRHGVTAEALQTVRARRKRFEEIEGAGAAA